MENFLQTMGLVLCVGAILVIALGAFLFRRLSGGRSRQPALGRKDDRMWREQGGERPRHDSSRIESRGGFGNAPSRRGAQAYTPRQSGEQIPRTGGLPSDRRGSNLDRGEAPPKRRSDQERRHDREDDDIRSSGGFGGG
jgi:hypothetical protein